jgi:hypothetical protein
VNAAAGVFSETGAVAPTPGFGEPTKRIGFRTPTWTTSESRRSLIASMPREAARPKNETPQTFVWGARNTFTERRGEERTCERWRFQS